MNFYSQDAPKLYFMEELSEINALTIFIVTIQAKEALYWIAFSRACREHSISGIVTNPINTLKETKTTS